MPTQNAPARWLDYLKGRGGFTIALLAAVLSVCLLAFVFEADGHLVLLLLALGLLTAVMEARIGAGNGS
jgi:hypothetical protein